MEDHINKELLFSYFSGKASPFEKKHIETWLGDLANRNLYYLWMHEWETANPQLSSDWQEAFHATRQRIAETASDPESGNGRTAFRIKPRSTGLWTLVASLLLLLGLGWLGSDTILFQTVSTTFGETKRYTLPDGSVVALNANTRIRFSRFGFTENLLPAFLSKGMNCREVELTGEADFTVKHLPDHRKFVVKTDKGLNVVVLGTEFTVFNRERRTQVVLRSGKVQLDLSENRKSSHLTMKPGDLVILNEGKLNLRKIKSPETLSDWKSHRFTFDNTSLDEIANLLRENYGLSVKLEGEGLSERTISGSFPAQNANELIRLVAELYQINYYRDDNSITFTN